MIRATYLATALCHTPACGTADIWRIGDRFKLICQQCAGSWGLNEFWEQTEEIVKTMDGLLPDARCRDCGLPYEAFPLDVNLPRSQWMEIHPEGEGGLLCAQCIVERAAKVPGCTVVHAVLEIAPVARRADVVIPKLPDEGAYAVRVLDAAAHWPPAKMRALATVLERLPHHAFMEASYLRQIAHRLDGKW